MKKLIVCILLFIFHIFYCQWIFAATEEAWFPDEIDIHYEPEKGMVVQTGDYEIDMKNKIFVIKEIPLYFLKIKKIFI